MGACYCNKEITLLVQKVGEARKSKDVTRQRMKLKNCKQKNQKVQIRFSKSQVSLDVHINK